MHEKQNDLIAQEKNVNIKPIDYNALNKLSEHFATYFVPQRQLSIEQAFWLPISKSTCEKPPVQPEPVPKEIPRELPRISLVKDSFNKMRNHVHNFDKVITVRTKVTCLAKEIIEMKEVFSQMETKVDDYSVERKCFEIKEKELLLENDHLLEHILYQDVMCIAMHADLGNKCVVPADNNHLEYAEMEQSYIDEYSKVLKLKVKLSKKKDMVEKDKKSKKVVAAKPMNKQKKVRFEEPKKSISNTSKQADSQNSKITNQPVLTSTIVKCSTSASGSQPSGNTKKNRISRTTSSNQKNKVEDHLRSVKSSLNKKNHVFECNASTKTNMFKANSKSVCKTCNECLFNACHDLCDVDYLNNVNKRAKSRSAKSNKKKDWKPTVLIDEQIKIGLSKFKIALEKSQPDVIYKVCLAILQEYSFFNAFTRIADALEIYMQQFWHTVHYDLTVKAYIFTIDDRDFEVNADWLSEALQITLKVFDHPFVNPPSENILWGMVIGENVNFVELIWEDFSDEIKASDDYSEYLAKSSGTQLAKGRGKVFEELAQSKGVKADTMDFEEIEEEDEIPLVRRQTGVVIGRQVQRDSTKVNLDQSSKLKGLETLSEAAQFKLDMKKAIKASKDDFIFQQRPRVLDEPSGNSSSSSLESNDEIKDIYNDEDDKTTKEKDENKQVADNQPMDKQAEKVQAEKSVHEPQVEKPAIPHPKPIETEVISVVEVLVTQETPAAQRPPLVDTTITLISEATLSPQQPPQTQPKRSKIKRILKKSNKPETQVDTAALDNRVSRLEKKVDAMSRFNIQAAIDKSIEARLKKNDLPKDVLDFQQVVKTYAYPSHTKHPYHKALYDALVLSLIVDEDDMDKQLKALSTLKKRHQDDNDQDPLADSEKEKKKRKQKDL
ncbi:hypothetical protein Tco_1058411 [Tanacetum coccineum]|uniref:Uncharacterized protein n=1 Tax=Tanacetum coccineum TaxID=301880 RepID=A0ABQ5H8B7_9ASTR